MSKYKEHNMDVIKDEPGSHEEACETDYYSIDEKAEEKFLLVSYPVLKSEGMEESWHGTRIKKEMKDEIISEQLEVCLDSIEQVLIEQDHGTTNSVTDVGESAVHEWDCTGMTDPLLLPETEGSGSSKVLLYSVTDKKRKKSHNVELNNTKTLNRSQDKPLRFEIYKKHVSECQNVLPQTRINLGDKPSKFELTYSRSHTNVKPFKCKECNKSFSQSGTLVSHLRTHTGEKPFKCKVCNKSFGQSSALVSHTRIHTGEKPFKCDVCNKRFRQSSPLVSHSRTHTGEKPFKCDVCNTRFRNCSTLVSHSRTHTGEKPFKCELCSKSFRQSSDLVSHSRSHTGEKPFKCELCNKCFTRLSYLRGHKCKYTGDNRNNCVV